MDGQKCLSAFSVPPLPRLSSAEKDRIGIYFAIRLPLSGDRHWKAYLSLRQKDPPRETSYPIQGKDWRHCEVSDPGSLHQPFPRAEPRKSLTEPSSYFGDSGIPPYPGGLLLAAAPSKLCLYGESPSAGQLLVAASAAYTASGCWVPSQDPCASLLGLSQLPSATP